MVIVALVLATGAPAIYSVEALVYVLAATALIVLIPKEFIARSAKAPVTNVCVFASEAMTQIHQTVCSSILE